MQSINSLFEWVEKSNQTQSAWALNYLLKLGWTLSNDQYKPPYENLMVSTQNLIVDEYAKGVVRKMRGAWSQKKLRDSRVNTKSYNFVLSTKAKSQLIWLNQIHRTTSSATIELLVELGFEYEKGAKKAVKEQIRAIKESTNKNSDRVRKRFAADFERNFNKLEKKYLCQKKEYEELENKYGALEIRHETLEGKYKAVEIKYEKLEEEYTRP